MQDLAIRTYVALENLQFRVQETLADQDGQTAAEYVGILAFVAAVLGIVIAAGSGIGSAIVTRITTLINSL
jgi:Flp pilus assembly pilin Flp